MTRDEGGSWDVQDAATLFVTFIQLQGHAGKSSFRHTVLRSAYCLLPAAYCLLVRLNYSPLTRMAPSPLRSVTEVTAFPSVPSACSGR